MKKITKAIVALLLLTAILCCAACKKAQPAPTLNGVKLENYTVIYSADDLDYSKRAAEYIAQGIFERTGIQLNVALDEAEPLENEIVVGQTNRSISQKLATPTEGMSFATLFDNGSIALEGDKFVIAAAAYFFVETYITAAVFDTAVPAEESVHQPITKEAENFIVLIGDGMGVYQTKLFQQYDATSGDAAQISDGENEFYGYKFPYQGFARTNSLSGITDSAASATALATGTKTINGYIGKDKDLNDLRSLTELAGSLEMATAVMSTEPVTGATPASFSAHADSRNNTTFIQLTQGTTRIKYGTVITGNFGSTDYSSKGIKKVESAITETISTLETNSEKGFFMMYEEAYVDKNCHSNDMDKAFLALVRFNQAIALFMEYAFYNPNTFVLITADHETGELMPDEDGVLKYKSGNHSNADVAVFVYGDGGQLFDDKTIENVQIPKTIASFWGVDDFGDTSNGYPSLTQ